MYPDNIEEEIGYSTLSGYPVVNLHYILLTVHVHVTGYMYLLLGQVPSFFPVLLLHYRVSQERGTSTTVTRERPRLQVVL